MPRDKALSHERIIRAARDEFSEYGFDKASMRRIGKRCGLTAAALYRHFDSKEAVSGALAAVICIDDPVREGVNTVINELRDRGFSRIVMMTGDSEKTAAYVAAKTGVDEYISEVLPEDKAEFIRSVRGGGHKVIMIGDGVNDSPALSEADAGIAVNTGAAIAREIADITIEAEDLRELLVLRDIYGALMRSIEGNNNNDCKTDNNSGSIAYSICCLRNSSEGERKIEIELLRECGISDPQGCRGHRCFSLSI